MRFAITIFLLASLFWGSWVIYENYSATPTIDSFRLHLLKKASQQIIGELPDPAIPQVVCIFPFVADTKGYLITRYIIKRIDDSGKYRSTAFEQLEKYCHNAKQSFLQLSPQEKFKIAKFFQADFALSGKVICFSKNSQQAQLGLQLSLYHLSKRSYIFQNRLFFGKLQPGYNLAYYRAWICSISLWTRILLWLAIITIMPFIIARPLYAMLKKESNTTNFSLLFTLTLAAVLMALLLNGFYLSSFFQTLAIVTAFLVASGYNYTIVSWLEYLRK